MVSVVAFTPILWNLSGQLSLFGVTLGHALFWIALMYVFATTVIAFWIGRPLIRFSFRNELTNAAFRYALVRMRDAAESISFYRGEGAEKSILRARFAAIISNYRGYVLRTLALLGWNQSINQIINPLPLVVQAPRLFAGQITFGDVTQSATAFFNVHDSLSFFRSVYDSFAAYRATIIRLDGLVDANEKARALPRLPPGAAPTDQLSCATSRFATPTARLCCDGLDLRLGPGESLVITGPSGCGRTTLLRSIARLWPYHHRHACCAPTATVTRCSCPRCPICRSGDLRAVLSYPQRECTVDDDRTARAALDSVALGHLRDRLNEFTDWAKVLSPGEQQRIAFARVLLQKPRLIFLDESTSAIDEGQEFAIYRLAANHGSPTASSFRSPTAGRSRSTTTIICELLGDGDLAIGSQGRQLSAGLDRPSGLRRRVLRPARRPKNDPSPSCVPLEYPLPSWAMLEAHAPAAYRPEITLPSSRSTWPSTFVARPPTVKPEYIALPSERSNAAHGPLSCGARNSGCLWKSGSSPLAAWSL